MHDDISLRHLEFRIRTMPPRAAARELDAIHHHIDIADLTDILRHRLRRTTLIADAKGLKLKPLRRDRRPS